MLKCFHITINRINNIYTGTRWLLKGLGRSIRRSPRTAWGRRGDIRRGYCRGIVELQADRAAGLLKVVKEIAVWVLRVVRKDMQGRYHVLPRTVRAGLRGRWADTPAGCCGRIVRCRKKDVVNYVNETNGSSTGLSDQWSFSLTNAGVCLSLL